MYKKPYLLTLLILLINLIDSSALLAHEPRKNVSGSFTLVVGNRVEPPYAGQPNRFDLFVRDLAGNPINDSEIDLDISIIFLQQEDFDSKILKSAQLLGELKQDSDNKNRFNIDYLPTKAGTYGFILKGTINGIYVHEKYVCGNGSLHPEGQAFSCVERLQEFPTPNGNQSRN